MESSRPCAHCGRDADWRGHLCCFCNRDNRHAHLHAHSHIKKEEKQRVLFHRSGIVFNLFLSRSLLSGVDQLFEGGLLFFMRKCTLDC